MKVLFLSLVPEGPDRKNRMLYQEINQTGMQVASCCGSHYFDLATIKDTASMYYAYPKIEKTVQQLSQEEVRGVALWINNDGRIPETGEDHQNVFDTFTLENGEKITFQYRKCE